MAMENLKFHQPVIVTFLHPDSNGVATSLPGTVQGRAPDGRIYVSHPADVIPSFLWPAGRKPGIWLLRVYRPEQINNRYKD